MPRKSAAALTAVPDVTGAQPLVPRPGMPEPVRAIFRELVGSVPSGHFRRCDSALLEQFAHAIILARLAYTELDAAGPVTADGKVSPWNVVLEKAHRSSVALAGRLRLAPQMREQSKTAGRRNGLTPSFYNTMEHTDEN